MAEYIVTEYLAVIGVVVVSLVLAAATYAIGLEHGEDRCLAKEKECQS